MLLGILIALLLAQADETSISPERQRAARAYAAAEECASAFAEASSLARDAIEAIPREAVAQCVEVGESLAQNIIAGLPGVTDLTDHDPEIVNDWVSARMRIAAADVLISRLERGEYLGSEGDDGEMQPLVDAAARLLFCMRVALGRELEGMFFGADWPLNMRGQTAAQISAAFVEVGRRGCPASEAAYLNAFDQMMNSVEPDLRASLRERLGLSAVQSLAVAPYLAIVPD